MNERLFCVSLNIVDPDETAAVAGSAALFMMPVGATLVYAAGSPMEDDAGATFDIQDDGTDIVTAVDLSDQDVPGEWASTHVGGANAPVAIAAGSELEIDINNAAAANRFDIQLWFLSGETWG